jgi:hypothetical protein
VTGPSIPSASRAIPMNATTNVSFVRARREAAPAANAHQGPPAGRRRMGFVLVDPGGYVRHDAPGLDPAGHLVRVLDGANGLAVVNINSPAGKNVGSSKRLQILAGCLCGESHARYRRRCTTPEDRAASSVLLQDHREPSARACCPNRHRPRARHAWSPSRRDATT